MESTVECKPILTTVYAYVDKEPDNDPETQIPSGTRFALKGHYARRTAANIYQLNEEDLDHDLQEYGFCTVDHLGEIIHIVEAGNTKEDLMKHIQKYEASMAGAI